jgi:hypothetical protein
MKITNLQNVRTEILIKNPRYSIIFILVASKNSVNFQIKKADILETEPSIVEKISTETEHSIAEPEKLCDTQKSATKKRKFDTKFERQTALKVVALRPGILKIGENSSDSDSSDDCNDGPRYDLLGRKIIKKCKG